MQKLIFTLRRTASSVFLKCRMLRNSVLGIFDKRRRFYAEFFIDRYIRNTFFPDFSYCGCAVEVGCATPELLSMSQHFRESGWRCIGIEANPDFIALHRARGNEVFQYAAADFEADNQDFVVAEASPNYSDSDLSGHSYSSLSIKPEYAEYKDGAIRFFSQKNIKVNVRRLDSILAAHCEDLGSIDLLAIDVEGYELEVMKGFTPRRYNVKVIVLENLFHRPDYTEYMQTIGYRLHKNIQYNYIYVPE